MKKLLLASTAIFLTQGANAATDELPTREEMWKMIQTQQKQIEALTEASQTNEAKIEEAKNEVIENIAQLDSASGATGWFNDTTIGGYGELHYNGGREGDDEVDFHRFVAYIGHEFNEDIRLFSEIEVEHADEIFLEQAYIEFDLTETDHARIGAFLMPVGIINENHEPTTFFGVERNPIETNIIPATWREAGVAFNGELGDGFSYDVALHSGLKIDATTDPTNPTSIRSGRGKISNQTANSGAVTGRVKYTGTPGLELAATAHYQQDITQSDAAGDADATLFEAHVDYRTGPWGLRALAARWDISGTEFKAAGEDEQFGFYVEPSYRFPLFEESEGGVFARYNYYDLAAGNNVDTEIEQLDIGFNLWPHPDVVLKSDIAFIHNEAGEDDEILNLGVGFVF